MNGIIELKACAKLNLGLDVLGKRPDGYHDIRTVMQTIDLYDELSVQLQDEPGIRLTSDSILAPADESNLVWRAAKLFLDAAAAGTGAEIHLRKKIPVAAGLAGGSTDAAATLLGLNVLTGKKLSIQELLRMGAKIGADVPYCILGGTALAEGIGEILTPLRLLQNCRFLLVKPPVSVSTKEAYEGLHAGFDGSESSVPPMPGGRPDTEGVIRAVSQNDLSLLAASMANVFEPGICAGYPVITSLLEELKENGALASRMSGSGPTVFGLFDREETARGALEKIHSVHPDCFAGLYSPCEGARKECMSL